MLGPLTSYNELNPSLLLLGQMRPGHAPDMVQLALSSLDILLTEVHHPA